MKILHTADIHLGTDTYGRLDPATGLNTRMLDFERSFSFMVERALQEEVDLFLFSGDAYRTADPTPTQQRAFAECLKPLTREGIPIVMIVGNHDHPVSFGKASAIDIFGYITGEVHVFRQPDMQRIQTRRGPLQLIALPWPIRSMILTKEEHRKKSATEIREFIEERYCSFVRQATQEADPTLPTILAAHLTVRGAEIAGSERTSLIAHEPTFGVGDLAVPPIDYVALGHIHRYQDRNPGGPQPVVYPGSIERVSFREAGDPKGFVIVTIEPDAGLERTTHFEFVETPARPFIPIDVDAREASDPTTVIIDAIEREDVTDAIVRIRYRIDESQLAAVDVRRIREALRAAEHVAAIERTVDPIERQRRTVVTHETTLEEALRLYIAQHDELESLEEDLIRAALELESELESTRHAD